MPSEATETVTTHSGGGPTVTVETFPGAEAPPEPTPDAAPKPGDKPAEAPAKAPDEVTPPVEEPKVAEDPKFSAKLAALARKGREIQQSAFALQEKEAAIVARDKEISAKHADVEAFLELKERAHQNPDDVLKALGLTYEQITQWYINDRKPTADMQIEMMRKAWEEERAERTAREESEKKAYEEKRAAYEAHQTQRQIQEAIHTVHGEIAAAPTEFPMVIKTNNQMEVWNLMALWMKDHNEVLPPKKAAAMIESTLREQYQQEAQTLLPTLAELGLVQYPSAPAGNQAQRSSPTLSNDKVSAAPTPAERQPLPPREQEMERALAILRAQRR